MACSMVLKGSLRKYVVTVGMVSLVAGCVSPPPSSPSNSGVSVSLPMPLPIPSSGRSNASKTESSSGESTPSTNSKKGQRSTSSSSSSSNKRLPASEGVSKTSSKTTQESSNTGRPANSGDPGFGELSQTEELPDMRDLPIKSTSSTSNSSKESRSSNYPSSAASQISEQNNSSDKATSSSDIPEITGRDDLTTTEKIAILDVSCIAIGFVLRLFAGSNATGIELSSWIITLTFLLALFLALAKRRDDVIREQRGEERTRSSIKDYNLRFLDQQRFV